MFDTPDFFRTVNGFHMLVFVFAWLAWRRFVSRKEHQRARQIPPRRSIRVRREWHGHYQVRARTHLQGPRDERTGVRRTQRAADPMPAMPGRPRRRTMRQRFDRQYR